MTFTASKSDLAGFDLYGHRQDDGSILIGFTDGEKREVDEWPEEVTFPGDFHTYTLEFVRKQTEDGTVKLDPHEAEERDEPGLEWGIYRMWEAECLGA